MPDTFQYTVTLPQSVKLYLPDPEQETKRLIAMNLYKKGGCSIAWAASVAGMGRYEFADLLIENGIEIPQQTVEDVMADADKIERMLASQCS
jgi:predicted HTH domain antitoxin